MPVLASAQAQINTKKIKIADLPEKVTKVVLTGNDLFDLVMQDEVAATWRVSPFEFCTLEEFESLKTNDDYYFLLTTKDQFKKESVPGIQFLSLLKGGKEAQDGIGEMLDVAAMPIASAQDPSGREFTFLSAFLNIIQTHAKQSIESDVTGYAGLTNHTENIQDCEGMKIVFAEEDLSSQITDDFRKNYFDEEIYVTDMDEADEEMADAAANTLVSLTVAPSEAKNGSYCYKMLIDAQTHTLYYFKRHKISKKDGVGFLAEDIKKISSHR